MTNVVLTGLFMRGYRRMIKLYHKKNDNKVFVDYFEDRDSIFKYIINKVNKVGNEICYMREWTNDKGWTMIDYGNHYKFYMFKEEKDNNE